MKCFKIDRTDRVRYTEDYSMVVIAKDEIDAEKYARTKSSNFKKAKLKVTKIDLFSEQVVLIANTGS